MQLHVRSEFHFSRHLDLVSFKCKVVFIADMIQANLNDSLKSIEPTGKQQRDRVRTINVHVHEKLY